VIDEMSDAVIVEMAGAESDARSPGKITKTFETDRLPVE
jgi:hypothetical protein